MDYGNLYTHTVYFNPFFGKVAAAVIYSKLQKKDSAKFYMVTEGKACKCIFDNKHVYDFSPSKS